jgi:hypothetical protein
VYTRGAPVLDGEYLDALANSSAILDYRASHLTAAAYPPTFASRTGAPAVLLALARGEFAAAVAADARAAGRVVMGNGALLTVPAAALHAYDIFVRV